MPGCIQPTFLISALRFFLYIYSECLPAFAFQESFLSSGSRDNWDCFQSFVLSRLLFFFFVIVS